MNLIVIKGRLVKDPEIRTTQSGVSVTNITVAVDRSFSADGDKVTDFFDCVFWRQGAEFVGKYFSKGKEIIVQGEMQSRKWQDNEGKNRVSWEIQNCRAEFCGGKTSGEKHEKNATAAADELVLTDEDRDNVPF